MTVAEVQAVTGCCKKLENFLSHNCLSQGAADSQCGVNQPLDVFTYLETGYTLLQLNDWMLEPGRMIGLGRGSVAIGDPNKSP